MKKLLTVLLLSTLTSSAALAYETTYPYRAKQPSVEVDWMSVEEDIPPAMGAPHLTPPNGGLSGGVQSAYAPIVLKAPISEETLSPLTPISSLIPPSTSSTPASPLNSALNRAMAQHTSHMPLSAAPVSTPRPFKLIPPGASAPSPVMPAVSAPLPVYSPRVAAAPVRAPMPAPVVAPAHVAAPATEVPPLLILQDPPEKPGASRATSFIDRIMDQHMPAGKPRYKLTETRRTVVRIPAVDTPTVPPATTPAAAMPPADIVDKTPMSIVAPTLPKPNPPATAAAEPAAQKPMALIPEAAPEKKHQPFVAVVQSPENKAEPAPEIVKGPAPFVAAAPAPKETVAEVKAAPVVEEKPAPAPIVRAEATPPADDFPTPVPQAKIDPIPEVKAEPAAPPVVAQAQPEKKVEAPAPQVAAPAPVEKPAAPPVEAKAEAPADITAPEPVATKTEPVKAPEPVKVAEAPVAAPAPAPVNPVEKVDLPPSPPEPIAAAPVEAKEPPAPVKEPEPVKVADATPPAPAVPSHSDMTIAFDTTSSNLTPAMEKQLDGIASQMNELPDTRLQIRAFAVGEDGNSSSARRMALSRALMVRSYLTDKGIKPLRLDVRALGAETDKTPKDRIDLVFVK